MFTELNWRVEQAALLKGSQKSSDEYYLYTHISNLIKSEIARRRCHLIEMDAHFLIHPTFTMSTQNTGTLITKHTSVKTFFCTI